MGSHPLGCLLLHVFEIFHNKVLKKDKENITRALESLEKMKQAFE